MRSLAQQLQRWPGVLALNLDDITIEEELTEVRVGVTVVIQRLGSCFGSGHRRVVSVENIRTSQTREVTAHSSKVTVRASLGSVVVMPYPPGSTESYVRA
jgi:hypothetical protein